MAFTADKTAKADANTGRSAHATGATKVAQKYPSMARPPSGFNAGKVSANYNALSSMKARLQGR